MSPRLSKRALGRASEESKRAIGRASEESKRAIGRASGASRLLCGLLGLSVLLGTGCSGDLTEAWEVIEPRLYGSRIEVEGDPGRATPKPGESFRLYPHLVVPRPLELPKESLYDLKMSLCLGFSAADGSLLCAGEL